MNKIEELIQQYCPDGVEFKKLGEVCEYFRGITYSKKDETDDVSGIKVLRANNISLKTNTLNFNDVKIVSNSVKVKENQKLKQNDILICAASGSKDHIGKVAYIFEDLDYAFGGFMAVLRTIYDLDSRFLFHLLIGQNFSKYLESALNTTTINNLNAQIMSGFQIPLPPLPIQQEIVTILDKFTTLEAELEARRAQYKYYRDQLLCFEGKGVEYKELGEIYDFKYGTGNTIPTIGGQYPVYGSNGIVGSHNEYNSEDSPVIGHIGAYAGIVNWGKGKHFVTYNGVICKLRSDIIIPQYGYYLLLLQDFISMAHSGSQPFVSYGMLNKVQIPIPPLAEQERIVGILDKFDALVNDISQGLPAEIKARRKQYEYYRSKLLSFEAR
ncbi:MAG: restriction endonuclease subunit S [Mangrovibacterium sp.]